MNASYEIVAWRKIFRIQFFKKNKTQSQLIVAFFPPTVNGKLNWVSRDPSNGPVSDEGKDLEIMEEGYYFLNLQVTLKTCNECPCNGTRGTKCMVRLSYNDQVLLQGWINTNTCSTGLLGKVEMLSGGSKLEFTINMPNNKIDESESLTHLDIIMLKA